MLRALLFYLAAGSALADERPHGAYCGNYKELYDCETHTGQLPHWKDPDDCINKKLNDFGVKLDSIMLYYDAGADQLTLEINKKIKTIMKQCDEYVKSGEDHLLDLGLETFPSAKQEAIEMSL
ncbi:hypothetical protein Pmar_PMAR014889 [Perkinsus marinus ATCC 50983]|uniref:Secreted protein n=1 Tax=Perkinsus marinus (strain ATCC 50983 / TXsc) TaxID=423536 RepID=C5L566_PERM5|nr:hypothetical protein Pmar_PMAR014889 [Perkinsus marinus ATCC 50983]EER08125.1 hypothetical protein Pmar_PMAR014889 [Perkinsus marinus ATCC 50983]|eukprot:XP_002776309.1 hypothetical protein Pmar_PMAR014889 [Perkinsus marinus ATCC 50983]